MANENRQIVLRKRLIYAGDLWHKTFDCEEPGDFRKAIENASTVDAVEVAKIKEVKQEILQVLDNLIDVDKPLAYWSINDASSYYSGKIQALEVARRLVNAALTDLCGAKMDGGKDDGV